MTVIQQMDPVELAVLNLEIVKLQVVSHFTTSANIGKIEFTYHPWSTTIDTNIKIGNRKITHKANEGYSTPIVDSIAFASTNEVKISTTATNLINEETRVCILKLKLYVVAK